MIAWKGATLLHKSDTKNQIISKVIQNDTQFSNLAQRQSFRLLQFYFPCLHLLPPLLQVLEI